MLKLGSQTGSFINHFMSQGVSATPQVGMGATFLSWTDRNPGTVVSYDDKKKIVGVTRDTAARVDTNAESESQEYTYTSNPDGPVHFFRLSKTGSWEGVYWNQNTNRWNRNQQQVVLGRREKYYDFSF